MYVYVGWGGEWGGCSGQGSGIHHGGWLFYRLLMIYVGTVYTDIINSKC